jgi:murein L,D-transpeptidase YcbB/YkuD
MADGGEGIEVTGFFQANSQGRAAIWRAALSVILLGTGVSAQAEGRQSGPYAHALAEAVSDDPALAAYYRDHDYADLWTGADDADRRAALLAAFAGAGDHGLPTRRYDPAALIESFKAARTEGDRGRVEAAMSRAYLSYARDLSSGALTPKKVDPGIVREIARPEATALLQAIAASPTPRSYLQSLAPAAPEYARLMKEKLLLEAKGGWGPEIAASALGPGDSGAAVLALRNQLIARGYLRPTAVAGYDQTLLRAVQRFQLDNGLTADGRDHCRAQRAGGGPAEIHHRGAGAAALDGRCAARVAPYLGQPARFRCPHHRRRPHHLSDPRGDRQECRRPAQPRVLG